MKYKALNIIMPGGIAGIRWACDRIGIGPGELDLLKAYPLDWESATGKSKLIISIIDTYSTRNQVRLKETKFMAVATRNKQSISLVSIKQRKSIICRILGHKRMESRHYDLVTCKRCNQILKNPMTDEINIFLDNAKIKEKII